MPSRRALVAVLAASPLALLGCGEKKTEPARPTTSIAAPPVAPPPTVSASAAASVAPAPSSAAPPTAPEGEAPIDGLATKVDTSGAPACVPGGVDFGFTVAIGSSDSAIAFCVDGNEKSEHGCFALDLASGGYHKLPKAPRGKVTKKRSTGKAHVIEALEKSLRVCPSDPARAADCATLDLGAVYRRGEAIPADVSPDGKKVVVVRDLGAGDTHNVEIWDLATKTRDKRVGLQGRGSLVGPVAWLGKRILVVSCVEAGPGCAPMLFDPETQKSTTASTNVYGVNLPAHRVAGSTWAFVSATGSELALVDVDTGAKKPSVALPLASEVEHGVAVIPRPSDRIAIVGSPPNTGQVVLVDLAPTPKVVKKYAPPTCK